MVGKRGDPWRSNRRRGRRLEDNLFVLTQCVEMARTEGRELWVAFLDIAKAYDCIEQAALWHSLRNKGLPGRVVDLLRELYTSTKVVVEWQGMRSGLVPIGRGLRQGCPLSPLLFMLFLSELEADLEGCGHGFDV